jgi:hypothetical protein
MRGRFAILRLIPPPPPLRARWRLGAALGHAEATLWRRALHLAFAAAQARRGAGPTAVGARDGGQVVLSPRLQVVLNLAREIHTHATHIHAQRGDPSPIVSAGDPDGRDRGNRLKASRRPSHDAVRPAWRTARGLIPTLGVSQAARAAAAGSAQATLPGGREHRAGSAFATGERGSLAAVPPGRATSRAAGVLRHRPTGRPREPELVPGAPRLTSGARPGAAAQVPHPPAAPARGLPALLERSLVPGAPAMAFRRPPFEAGAPAPIAAATPAPPAAPRAAVIDVDALDRELWKRFDKRIRFEAERQGRG